MVVLTVRQQEVLQFLRRYISREGMPPTQMEIAQAFGFTQKTTAQHLRLMAAKGDTGTSSRPFAGNPSEALC